MGKKGYMKCYLDRVYACLICLAVCGGALGEKVGGDPYDDAYQGDDSEDANPIHYERRQDANVLYLEVNPGHTLLLGGGRGKILFIHVFICSNSTLSFLLKNKPPNIRSFRLY